MSDKPSTPSSAKVAAAHAGRRMDQGPAGRLGRAVAATEGLARRTRGAVEGPGATLRALNYVHTNGLVGQHLRDIPTEVGPPDRVQVVARKLMQLEMIPKSTPLAGGIPIAVLPRHAFDAERVARACPRVEAQWLLLEQPRHVPMTPASTTTSRPWTSPTARFRRRRRTSRPMVTSSPVVPVRTGPYWNTTHSSGTVWLRSTCGSPAAGRTTNSDRSSRRRRSIGDP